MELMVFFFFLWCIIKKGEFKIVSGMLGKKVLTPFVSVCMHATCFFIFHFNVLCLMSLSEPTHLVNASL